MRYFLTTAVACLALANGCSWRDSESRKQQAAKPDPAVVQPKPPENPDSLSYKAGKAAHDVAKETGKAARAAGRKVQEAARNANEGWKDAERQDKTKSPTPR